MVTSISINSHLPHALFTGCRFLPFNFIAARQLRRASSLMRFCTVVRSHNSCNFLWYLRNQILHFIQPADLVLVSERTFGLRRVFQHPWHFDYRLNPSLRCPGILLSLQLTDSHELSWSAGYLQGLPNCDWSGICGKFLCLGFWSSFAYLGFDLFSATCLTAFCFDLPGINLSQLSAVGSGEIWFARFATTLVSPFLVII